MTEIRRRPLVGGNWKMHFLREEVEAYCRAFASAADELSAEVVLFPSFPLLPAVAAALAGSAVTWGGQDLHAEESGAFTGDVSGGQLKDAGCTWALCGHSERRRDHSESDELVARKATATLRAGLIPLICLGETAEERERNETFTVLERQLSGALEDRPDPFAIAYEPVWAIGTGKTATPAMAQEAHRHLRIVMADLIGDEAANTKRILYGGSVNPGNAAELHAQPDIDGFLVGGASLDPERFLAIIRSCG
jgi:triosephosphate isomerase